MKKYILEHDARNNAIRDAKAEQFDMAVVQELSGDYRFFLVIALDDPTIEEYEFIAAYNVKGECIMDERFIVVERHEGYFEMVYPSGKRTTAKTRILITGYCKKNSITIVQEVDCRPKYVSTVWKPF